MKVAVFKGPHHIDIEERPIPDINPGEVLVHIKATGICGSDLHGFQGLIPERRTPGLVMGHEAAGQVIKVGSGVAKIKAGDRVAIDPQLPCGKCEQCLRGSYNICENMRFIGSSMREKIDGTFREYIAMPERNLHLLPDEVSFLEGAMLEPVSNAIHAIIRAKLNIGDEVVIMGAGTMGLLLLQVAKLAGAGSLFVIDILASRLKVARALGADVCVNATEQEPVEFILQRTNGKGVDVAIEAVGFRKTYHQCVQMVKRKGTVVTLGIFDELVDFPMIKVIFSELNIVGTTGFTWECERALQLIASGRINVKPLITHQFSLLQAQKAFEILDKGEGNPVKVMLIP